MVVSPAPGGPSCVVQDELRFGLSLIGKKLGWICCENKELAEPHSILPRVTYLEKLKSQVGGLFFDASCGIPLFSAALNRTLDEWWDESLSHGWPSFRDSEVFWGNVLRKPGGEIVSRCGTHLGHDLPDEAGSRYCINLLCIAGTPSVNSSIFEIKKSIVSSQQLKDQYSQYNTSSAVTDTTTNSLNTSPPLVGSEPSSYNLRVVMSLVFLTWVIGVFVFLRKKKGRSTRQKT
eukprot:TRINITY_DN1886_c1_g1_i1.p1 TRINITY_DN1886_c1_g1~~TRINITY_DN1886_c1_g1_i1.p1  ORF type:complete len:233 (+),score=30.92 TRINITY_DN1886_c1_g1_i1:206-904(+)